MLTDWRGVQQYNDLRENTFKTWKVNESNIIPLFIMVVVFPCTAYTLTKQELVRVAASPICHAVAHTRAVPRLTDHKQQAAGPHGQASEVHLLVMRVWHQQEEYKFCG